MCIAAIGLAPLLSGLGTAVSAVGAVAQGQAANAAAKAQAQAIEQQSQAEQKASAFEANQRFRQQELQRANARAQIAASGVGFAGSPTAALVANAGQGQLDLEAIRWGSQMRQNNLATQAGLTRMQGRQAMTAGFINAGSTAIGGLGRAVEYDRAVRFGQNQFA